MTPVRHSARVHARVLELYAAEWGPLNIQRIIAKEHPDVPVPNRSAIYRWTHPEAAELENVRRRGTTAHYSGAWPGRPSPEWKELRIRALRSAGLSFAAIATVMNLDFPKDPKLNGEQLRYRLKGEPKP